MEETEKKVQNSNNPKGGRPPKKVKRQSQLMVRLTENERFLIDAKARAAGMKSSSWIRAAAKKAKVTSRLTPEDTSFLRMLAGMANNLNQLVRLAHIEGLLSVHKKCRECLYEIDDILKKLSSDDR